jgi:hypothetical protein
MSATGTSKSSTEVARLVESVEQLAEADQHRILRLVTLLTRVPPPVQRTTRHMLRSLLDTDPDSAEECVEGLDEVIEYLENEVIAHNGPIAPFTQLQPVTEPGSGRN